MYCFRENSNFPFSNQKIITLTLSHWMKTEGQGQNVLRLVFVKVHTPSLPLANYSQGINI